MAGAAAVTGSAAITEKPDLCAAAGAATLLSVLMDKIAPFFSTDTITTAGYQLYRYNAGGTLVADGSHTTSGITAIANVTNGYTIGINAATATLNADGSYHGVIVWDSGGGSPFYVADEVNIPPTTVGIDLTQAVPTSNMAQTVGDALNAARAQGFGKWTVSGTTLTLYANDGTTAVRTFTLDSSSAPTQRV
jgi:hypothetical protein